MPVGVGSPFDSPASLASLTLNRPNTGSSLAARSAHEGSGLGKAGSRLRPAPPDPGGFEFPRSGLHSADNVRPSDAATAKRSLAASTGPVAERGGPLPEERPERYACAALARVWEHV